MHTDLGGLLEQNKENSGNKRMIIPESVQVFDSARSSTDCTCVSLRTDLRPPLPSALPSPALKSRDTHWLVSPELFSWQ